MSLEGVWWVTLYFPSSYNKGHDLSLKLLCSSSCLVSMVGVLDKSNMFVTRKSCYTGGLFFSPPAWLTQSRKLTVRKYLGVLKYSGWKASHWREAAIELWMQLFVSILTAISFQKHLLHRFTLGKLRSCAEQRTLSWGSLWFPVAFNFEAHDSLEGHSLQTKVSISSHHMWLKDWIHQAPATILFPGLFLLSTTD